MNRSFTRVRSGFGGRCRLRVVLRITMLLAIQVGCAAGHGPRGSTNSPEPQFDNGDGSNGFQGDIDATLFLMGDVGRASAGLPVLEELKLQASSAPGAVAIIFLGDNVYQSGLLPVGHPRRRIGEERLRVLAAVPHEAGVRGVFMPGNHDWDDERENGWQSIRDQQEFIDGLGFEGVSFLPKGGCPGPEVMDVGSELRVVILDTQWWLHEGPKPTPENSDCSPATEVGVLTTLDSMLTASSDRQTILAAHHPFDSGGPHGGYYGWKDHFFPLLRVSRAGWLPLPGVGSLFVLARSLWKPRQDLASPPYQSMIDSIERVTRRHDLVASTGGHDHSLQVLLSDATRYVLVSGTGPSTGLTPTAAKANTLFAASHWGFMRVEVFVGGRVRLRVFGEEEGGMIRELYWRWLSP